MASRSALVVQNNSTFGRKVGPCYVSRCRIATTSAESESPAFSMQLAGLKCGKRALGLLGMSSADRLRILNSLATKRGKMEAVRLRHTFARPPVADPWSVCSSVACFPALSARFRVFSLLYLFSPSLKQFILVSVRFVGGGCAAPPGCLAAHSEC